MSSSERPTCSRLVSSSRVNHKIIDYYLKYATDRDIEKFMRFNNSSSCCTSKSSSDENNMICEDNELILAFQPCDKIPKAKNPSPLAPYDEKYDSNKEHAENNPELPQTPVKNSDICTQLPDSITKTDKKLEWDSLADVGYKKANSTGNISSLERSVLKELFSESPSVPNIYQHQSDEVKPSSSHSLSTESRRERWRQTLESLGKKYSSNSASLNTQEFIEQPQSTPKVIPNTEKSCQTTFEKNKSLVKPSAPQRKDHSCQTSFDRTNIEQKKIENFSQTSIARTNTQEVQANLSSRTGSFATQSSFEYHPAGSETSKSSARRSILSENHSNSNKSRSTSESDKENQLTRRTNKGKSEVDLGIKLLCSLIDAKNLSGVQKKSLAKKIFEKIMKQHSSASMSSSVSSAFSVRSLIDCPPLCEDQKVISKSSLGSRRKVVEQMSEQTQTENQECEENHPTSSSSHEEPVTMREWLNPLTKSEKAYDRRLKQRSQADAAQTSERQKQLSWIEVEINRLEALKNLILQEGPDKSRSRSSTSTIRSAIQSETIYEETSGNVVEDQYKSTTRRSSQNIVIYDEPTADRQPEVGNIETKSSEIINKEEPCYSGSLQKNNRSKLETPTSSTSPERESVGAFADQLQKQFMDTYSKKKRSLSEHYSEPRVCGKPIFPRNPSYTSVASSAFCMSSEMSIPIVESSSTSTTTHQYDSHGCEGVEGVAVQTTYSVIKSDPIFGPRCRCMCACGKKCKCSCPRPTVRVSGKALHQTVQVKPKALAYVIHFKETCDGEGNKVTEESVTLQQRLQMRNPDFCSKADERREILRKLHVLRQEREERIREIADSSNASSITRKLDELPSPPIKHIRICPTREMKGMTKKRYCKLPEVVAKQEREKLERRKKSTRVITNIFNKKLQRMVHNGKLSLEYSRTVI